MKSLSLDDIKFYPAIPFTVALSLGIIIQDKSPLPVFYLISVFSLSILFMFFLKRRELLRLIPLLTLLVGYSTGAALYTTATRDFEDDPFNQQKISHLKLSATVKRINEINSDKIDFIGSIIEVSYDSTYKDVATGKQNKIKLKKEFQKSIEFVFKLREPEDSLLKILMKEMIPGRVLSLTGNFSKPLQKRNPGGFDYHDYLKRQSISGIIYIDRDSLFKISGNHSPVTGGIYLLRKNIGDLIDRVHNKSTAAMLRGLIIADRTQIDEEVVNGYVNTGIAHILAVSGFNVAVIYLLTLLLLQKLRYRSRFTELVLRLLVLFLFLVITQFQVTVVRAVLMFSVHSILIYSGRLNNRWNTLAITASLILLFNPQDIFTVSFQLSVVAVASLFIAESMVSGMRSNLQAKVLTLDNRQSRDFFTRFLNSRIIRQSSELVLITLFVQFGMLPFLIIYFGKISLLSLPANIVAVPISSGLLINGLITLLISSFSIATAELFASGSEFANYLLNNYIFWLDQSDVGVLNYELFTSSDVIVFYALFLLLIIVYTRKTSWKWRLSSFFTAVVIFSTFHLITRSSPISAGVSHILAIDVGQGDCYLLLTPENKTILIDAGNLDKSYDAGKMVLIPVFQKLGIEKIDAAFISHYDNDHAGGMITLINEGLLTKLFLPPPDTLNVDDLSLFNLLKLHNNVEIMEKGTVLSSPQLSVELLTEYDSIPFESESNRRSAVMMVTFENQKILFTGDLDKNGEMALIRNNINLKCDLLKVSHHGSRSGTSVEFLSHSQPSYALISAGVANRYNHPHPLEIDRLENQNCRIFRTDIEGALIFRIENKKIVKVNWR